MELTSNLLQFLVTLLGFCLAAILYHQNRRQAYFLLACFYGCFALGSLYWTLYLLLFSETPRVFYVSEFGWIASVIFLRILQYALSGEEERAFKCRAAWLSAIVGVPLMALYCAYGDILPNLIWCGLVMVLAYGSIRGLAYAREQTGRARDMQYFHIGVLYFAAAENALWTSGCLWRNDGILGPSFWCDLLLTCCILGLLPAVRKAVGP